MILQLVMVLCKIVAAGEAVAVHLLLDMTL